MKQQPVETLMAREINEIPQVIARQIEGSLDNYIRVGREAASSNPRGFVTCARGTSDHVATFFKYVIEMKTGLPVASIGPSVASVYDASLKLSDFYCLTFSQSGGSPDLVALLRAAQLGGATTIAFLNVTDSPVGRNANILLALMAGPEKAVAATKTFVAMLFAVLGFVAGFTNDPDLELALRSFPLSAEAALGNDWSGAEIALARAGSLFTVGRGPGLAVAAEAALKLKETCRKHAEVCSAAEVLHGPVVIAEKGFAALVFDPDDQSQDSVLAAADVINRRGASVFMISSKPAESGILPTPKAEHIHLLPLVQIIGFYDFIEKLSRKLGESGDAPAGLNKVTITI